MKARIRGTNIEVDVQPLYDETGYFDGFTDGYNYYHSADLVFPDTPDWDKTDWSSFRREAAKDILCSLIHDGRMRADASTVKSSIWLAEELISQLKEG